MHHTPAIIEGNRMRSLVPNGNLRDNSTASISIPSNAPPLRSASPIPKPRMIPPLDGIDMLAVLLSRKLPFGTSDLILFFNLFVFIFVSAVFGLQGALLSVIAYYIASKVIHVVEEGLSGSKTFQIITTEPELMVETIRDQLGRSATYKEAYGIWCLLSD